ncbi:MAG: 16S rRNA (guanine(527)-N(7))-methyltransferase RsmG [Bacteroidota bacterium]|nr:16S rRNA (guanine(527)-N(7))-methyltransferase RsmG [Bacteroidota bacterium]
MVRVQEHYYKELYSLFWDNNFVPEETQIERLAFLAELISEKNKVVNLVSRKDTESLIENHIFITAFISKFLPDKCSRFLDIGTGGGFPGLPVAIVKPHLKGVLADSTGKKIDSVKEFIEKLKLGNVTAVNSRVEAPEFINLYRNSFDLILSRATVPLLLLISYSLPLIKEKAYLAAIKGGDLEDEFQKAVLKYKPYIKKHTIFELAYKPGNIRNQKGKKLVLLELNK